VSKTDTIIARITRDINLENMVDILSELPPEDLQSLLLYIYNQRTHVLKPSDLMQQYRQSRFVKPCVLDQRKIVAADHIAFKILPSTFTAIEFSPVIPLGTNSILANTSQKNVLGTIRNNEVLADPTSALALECALRRTVLLQGDPKNIGLVKLATSSRSLRLQSFDDIPGFTPHFRTFSIASAGRDTGSEVFEKVTFLEHVTFYLNYLNSLANEGYITNHITVAFSDIRIIEKLIEKDGLDREQIGRSTQKVDFDVFKNYNISLPHSVLSVDEVSRELVSTYNLNKPIELLSIIEESVITKLRKQFPLVAFAVELNRIAGIGYYSNLCFKISAQNRAGTVFPLVDGGYTNWTQKLMNSKKERLLISGIGTELLCKLFK